MILSSDKLAGIMWSIPNDNPEGRAFFVVTIVFIVISMFVFGLRIYSRRLHKSSFDASDYSCLLGVVSCQKLHMGNPVCDN